MDLIKIIKVNHQKLVMFQKRFDISSIPGIGIICALISVIFWSTASLCIKISKDVHALEVLTISAIIQSVIYYLVMLCKRQPFLGEPKERIHLVLRCTLGTISMACLYTSYRLISLSDATTMRFTAPVFVSLFAYIILREPFGITEIINAGMTLIGVLLIGRPSFLFTSNVYENEDIIGIALALSSAISIAISMTIMRKLQKTPSAVVIFWFSVSTVLLGLVALYILDEFKMPNKATLWLIIIVTGISGALDQLFITLALKLENAGPISVVRAFSVVISFIFSATILNEKILWTSFLGGTLIFMSIVILGLSKWYKDFEKSKDSKQDEQLEKNCQQLNGDPKNINYCFYNNNNDIKD